MDPMVVAAGINAASTLAGGLMGDRSTGGDMRNMREANTAAIAGKIKAADKFGISRLYALGAPTVSPAVNVGGGPTLGETISSMGADVSRAVAAGQTEAERTLQALTLDKAALENDFLREQIASIRARTARESGPALPAPNKLRLPGGFGTVTMRDPKYAQKVQDWGGDLAENVFGTLGGVEDMINSFATWYADPNYWNGFANDVAKYAPYFVTTKPAWHKRGYR